MRITRRPRFCFAAWRAGPRCYNGISAWRAHGYFVKPPALHSARLRSLRVYIKDIVAFGDIDCPRDGDGGFSVSTLAAEEPSYIDFRKRSFDRFVARLTAVERCL